MSGAWSVTHLCDDVQGTDGSERPTGSSLAGVEDESDVLPAPQLTDTAGAPLQRPLTSLEQALLLGWAAHVSFRTMRCASI